MRRACLMGVALLLAHGAAGQDLLSELPLDKLLRLRAALIESTPAAQAFDQLQETKSPLGETAALHRRGDHEHGHGEGKIASVFSLSVTALAFLAFSGYLLCLIVHAVKYKHSMEATAATPTFLVSAGIKKRPVSSFASYGRTDGADMDAADLDVDTADGLHSALLRLCEAYAVWDNATRHKL